MTHAPPITLLTDFGLDDPYVGVLKAALLRDWPAARIVSLSLSLSLSLAPFDKIAAAFWTFGSFGTGELATREGHAAAAFGVRRGAPVGVYRMPDP